MIATPTAPTVRTVHSTDGTTISYHTTGSGPDILIIPGALNDAADYTTLATALAAHFTVHTIQRRARTGSGPQGPDYSIATECADLAAVRAATGARYIFGHSYGGLVALEAARRDPGIAKLALYEPGVSVQGLFPMDWTPQYRRFLAQGRPFDAFATFAISTGPAAARRNPRWLMSAILRLVFRGERRAKIFQLLEANLREHEQVGRLDDSYPNYREVSADVLLMAGGKSGLPYVAPAFDRLTEVLPSARVHTFANLDHFGPDHKGPAEVADTVTAFLLN
ncbi:alpha/beta fold hydrolase [Dactylosporangium sp. NPDC048998]|uniref:alpha/beta fold hydrolase n=1 Tax=Dactylosporangium sp. NPDC048998 TaxID=3363976 RepID=UPI00371B936C